jgi:hypothetical protein
MEHANCTRCPYKLLLYVQHSARGIVRAAKQGAIRNGMLGRDDTCADSQLSTEANNIKKTEILVEKLAQPCYLLYSSLPWMTVWQIDCMCMSNY